MRAQAARIIGCCLCAFLFLSGCDREPEYTDYLTLGQSVPDIPLIDLDGGQHQLSDYRGRIIVLNVWGTWCAACRFELPSLQALSDSLPSDRFVVIGLAADSDEHVVREFLIDKQVTFTSYMDAGEHVVIRQMLGVPIFPYTFVIDADGKLLQRIAGPREWDSAEWRETLQGYLRQ